ncbi:cupin domain-containing protein [Streptomyces sp. MspMP-M5]|uniref:cupin domain-containing protein n=1 Tax=unclassified Streptomyces TaxID=2593676 RepID=UPI00039F578B|nr:cupin domain-containing protein [Streptomyces sp. MspMP-M5]
MSQTNRATVEKVRFSDVPPNRRRGGEIRVGLSPSTVGSVSGFMGAVTLEPGDYVSEHYHPYSEEFLYVVRGQLVVTVDGADIDLAPDEGIMVPIGARHRLVNHGSESALAVIHLSPLAPEPRLGHVDTEPLPNPDEPTLHVAGSD